MQAAKRILRYVKGTTDLAIQYKRSENGDFTAYTNSDYACDNDDRKSTSGYVFILASKAVCWKSKKQLVVTLSTTEAEFIAAASCACQTMLRRILLNLKLPQSKASVIYLSCSKILCSMEEANA